MVKHQQKYGSATNLLYFQWSPLSKKKHHTYLPWFWYIYICVYIYIYILTFFLAHLAHVSGIKKIVAANRIMDVTTCFWVASPLSVCFGLGNPASSPRPPLDRWIVAFTGGTRWNHHAKNWWLSSGFCWQLSLTTVTVFTLQSHVWWLNPHFMSYLDKAWIFRWLTNKLTTQCLPVDPFTPFVCSISGGWSHNFLVFFFCCQGFSQLNHHDLSVGLVLLSEINHDKLC